MRFSSLNEGSQRSVDDSVVSPAAVSGPVKINNVLPLETILRIFHDIIPKFDDSYPPLPSYHWLGITHVCRYWRLMALQDPTLWQHIETTRLDCVRAFLARSQSLPLFVTCFELAKFRRTTRGDAIAIIKTILPELHRVAVFTLSDHQLCTYFLAQTMSRRVPLMRHLLLNPEDTWIWDRSKLDECLLPESANVRGNLPMLETLRCTHLPAGPFTIKSILAGSPCLRVLEVVRPGRLTSVDEWASLLLTLPSLEVLSLCTAISSEMGTLGGSIIHLPHLEELRLTATNTTTGEYALLERLIIPPTAAVVVHIVLCDGGDSFESSNRLISAVRTCLTASGQRRPPQKLHMSLNGYTISVVACEAVQDVDLCVKHSARSSQYSSRSHVSLDRLQPGSFCLSMKQHLIAEGSLMFTIRDLLTSVYSFAEVRSLQLVTDELAVVRNPPLALLGLCFSEMFGTMNKLSALTIDSSDFMYAAALYCAGFNPRGMQVFFPNLKQLGIRLPRLSSCASRRGGKAPDPRIEKLKHLLCLRDEKGYRVERVHICEVRESSSLQTLQVQTHSSIDACTSLKSAVPGFFTS